MSSGTDAALVIDERRIAVPGGEVFVRRWQPASVAAPVVPWVLLHDSLGCVGLWRDFAALLAQALQAPVIAYDRPGFGQSAAQAARPPQDFIEAEARDVFPSLREALGLQHYRLLGHSVGGSMALAIAAGDPHGCLGVVSESAQPYVQARTLEGVRAAKASFAEPGQLQRLQRWHGDKARWVLDAWIGTWLDPVRAGWSLDPLLRQVACPVLAIHGDADEFGTVEFAHHITATVAGPAEAWIIEGGGHVPHRQMPGAVLARLRQWLATAC